MRLTSITIASLVTAAFAVPSPTEPEDALDRRLAEPQEALDKRQQNIPQLLQLYASDDRFVNAC